jgi:hypothetical protein
MPRGCSGLCPQGEVRGVTCSACCSPVGSQVMQAALKADDGEN